jgi:hypothetical protein
VKRRDRKTKLDFQNAAEHYLRIDDEKLGKMLGFRSGIGGV